VEGGVIHLPCLAQVMRRRRRASWLGKGKEGESVGANVGEIFSHRMIWGGSAVSSGTGRGKGISGGGLVQLWEIERNVMTGRVLSQK